MQDDKWNQYAQKVTDDIETCLEALSCQPILFIGSGFSRRYFNAPTWDALLQEMAEQCPKIDQEFAYYKQSYQENLKIAEIFSEKYMDWAWSKEGKEFFPEHLFDASISKSAFFKEKVAQHLEKLTPKSLSDISDPRLKEEVELLKNIQPHAIITTNYDTFLEKVFPDFEPIIGEQVLRGRHDSIGEIFKIHGCVSNPNSIVITQSDFEGYINKKKYLSAKLLTYFMEHPLIFMGYSANDPNIREILSDIDEILSAQDKLIDNIYIVAWKPDKISLLDDLKTEELIQIENNKSVRIKNISYDPAIDAGGSVKICSKEFPVWPFGAYAFPGRPASMAGS